MKQLNFVVSLTTDDNDYQMEQARAAEEMARRLDVSLEIIFAGNDSITQSQQLLKFIQSSNAHPDGIVFEPVGGTALPQVARAAVSAGIAWVVLNRDVDYLSELRAAQRSPAFAITSDHEEIGRIQGRQLGALLPNGGSVLYITGPSDSLAAKQRTGGMLETKPAGIQVKMMKGQWTEGSAHHLINSWLRLSISRQSRVEAVACQNDAMALGARKAFEALSNAEDRERWLKVPYLGCDGVPKTGQDWVRQGLLAATIVVPPITGRALEMLVQTLRGGSEPAERILTVPTSFPAIEGLAGIRRMKAQAASGC
jgi:ABC-type sugar transport system substrate-binding protein